MSLDYIKLADKANCTGCGVCQKVCPQSCISFESDFNGFYYPIIEETKCIKCKKCINHCPEIVHVNRKDSIKAYCAKAKDNNILKNAASGGAFGAIASDILRSGGIVYGCSSSYESKWKAKIVRLDSAKQLSFILGSKYYESDARDSFSLVKNDLDSGKRVLYGGRPCQVAALLSYLDKSNTENLFTIDIVCHGISSYKFFCDYIRVYEQNNHGRVIDYRFRAHKKKDDRGYFGRAILSTKNDRQREKVIIWQCDSFYYHYMMGNSFRTSCFNCQYANHKRSGSITLGDFWGIEKIIKGVHVGNTSLVLVNDKKGERLLEESTGLEIIKVGTEDAIMNNGALNHPVSEPIVERERLFRMYKQGGWSEIDKKFRWTRIRQKLFATFSFYTPQIVKECIRRIKRRG